MSMKLTEKQISVINTFLDKKRLLQVDIRNEIFDHIVTAIENDLANNISFDRSTSRVFKEWQAALTDHQSFWIGLIWSGPKILIDKTVHYTKRAYLKMLLIVVPILFLCFLVPKKFIEQGIATFLNTAFGSIYLALFLMLLVFHYRIKRTKSNSTYSFLFKIHAFVFGFSYLIYNPLLIDILAIDANNHFWIPVVFHTCILAFSYSFYGWYKSHMNLKNVR